MIIQSRPDFFQIIAFFHFAFQGCRRCGLAGHYVDVHDITDPEFRKLIVQTIGVDIYGDTDMAGIENGQEPLLAMPNQLNPNTLSDWYAA